MPTGGSLKSEQLMGAYGSELGLVPPRPVSDGAHVWGPETLASRWVHLGALRTAQDGAETSPPRRSRVRPEVPSHPGSRLGAAHSATPIDCKKNDTVLRALARAAPLGARRTRIYNGLASLTLAPTRLRPGGEISR